MAVTRAKGLQLFFGDDQSPEGFDLVNKMLEVGVPGVAWDTEEVTPQETTLLRKEFLPTIADNGELTFTILYNPSDAVHAALKALANSSVARNWRIVYPGIIGQLTFSGFITAAPPLNPKAEYTKWSFTVKVTGLASDTLPAEIQAVEFTDAHNGAYETGETIQIRVTFDEVVVVDEGGGTPYVDVDINTTAVEVAYVSGSGGHQLTFEYQVQAGEAATAGQFAVNSPLVLDGGTIKDLAGNNVGLTFTPPNTSAFTVTDTS